MSSYSVVDEQTGVVMRQGITSTQLAAADKLLQASKRLQLHQAVSRRSVWRDRDIRYGNSRQHPYGVSKPAHGRSSRKKPNASADVALAAGAALCTVLLVIILR